MLALLVALYKGAIAGHTLLLTTVDTTVQFGSAADKIYLTVCAACLAWRPGLGKSNAWVWFGGRLAVVL
eukprot:COSAG05_NODE_17118_length_331_cov_1.318966_1_plen_69_part_00